MGTAQNLDTTKKKKPIVRKVIENLFSVILAYFLIIFLDPYFDKYESAMMTGLFWVLVIAYSISIIYQLNEFSKRQKVLQLTWIATLILGGIVGYIIKASWRGFWGGGLTALFFTIVFYLAFSDQIDARLESD